MSCHFPVEGYNLWEIFCFGLFRCFVFWKIVFLLGSALCIGVLRGELLGGLRNGVKVKGEYRM